VPMLQPGGKPDDVSGPNFLYGPRVALHPPKTRDNDQYLTDRMRVPGGACARLEGNAPRAGAGWLGWRVERIDAPLPIKYRSGPF
jgi:hypothetical protein